MHANSDEHPRPRFITRALRGDFVAPRYLLRPDCWFDGVPWTQSGSPPESRPENYLTICPRLGRGSPFRVMTRNPRAEVRRRDPKRKIGAEGASWRRTMENRMVFVDKQIGSVRKDTIIFAISPHGWCDMDASFCLIARDRVSQIQVWTLPVSYSVRLCITHTLLL